MKCFVLAVVAVLVVAIVAFPQDRERVPAADENLDTELGGEEDLGEEPLPVKTTVTARSSRRRVTSSRTKTPAKAAVNGDSASSSSSSSSSGDTKTTTTTSTEKPTKRTRTTTASSSSRTSTKSPTDETGEEPASTYKRPKFPPRRLPPPTQKPAVVEEPLEEAGVDGELHPIEGEEGVILEEPIDEEPLVEEEIRR